MVYPADSSATDTDPEAESNDQMSQYGMNGPVEGVKRAKSKKRTKSGSLVIKGEAKQKNKVKKEKRDIKKEKENKDLYKKQKVSI